jgi:ribonuclease-3
MERHQQDSVDELDQNFSLQTGIKFEHPWLIRRALTHRSYLNENPGFLEDNERLEFLGDAILDFLVAAWLYNHFPEMSEGRLTRLRASLVGNDQLAEFAKKIGLGNFMLLGKGEDEGGGRNRRGLLGSTFEAVIGAYYLDQGISAVQDFVQPMLESTTQIILSANRDSDPKSQLQEWSQSKGLGPPVYKTVSTSGPDHDKTFKIEVIISGEVFGSGEGHSKQLAAKAAATQALEKVGSHS